jgi:hypothetical protein
VSLMAALEILLARTIGPPFGGQVKITEICSHNDGERYPATKKFP